MITVNASYLELAGSNYEIGRRLGQAAAKMAADMPGGAPPLPVLGVDDAKLAKESFDAWCPGITDEIEGYADALGVAPAKTPFYAMTYLRPNCSQATVLPGKTKNGHVLQARSYEMSYLLEDFVLARTSVAGKYTHLGTTVMGLGREDGLNEKGLGVTMSSCGFPVGAMPGMRQPVLRGLQFWAVLRALLENCADVAEALDYLGDMPIAYNLNMIIADRGGHAALYETLNGRKAYRLFDGNGEQFLCATNHPHIEELSKLEPVGMVNSARRYGYITKYIDGIEAVNMNDLKKLLLGGYPEGLACHYHDEYFGTTKSVVMDLNEGALDICWGGLEENGWRSFNINKALDNSAHQVLIPNEKCPEGFFEMVDCGPAAYQFL